MASNFLRLEGDKSALDAAGEVAAHPETWLDFPLPDVDADGDFEMSDAQQKLGEHLAPWLDAFRINLCMSTNCFWKMLFLRLKSRLGEEDTLISSSTSQTLKVRASLSREGDKSARGVIGLPDMVVSLAREVAKNPETWFDFSLQDDVDSGYKVIGTVVDDRGFYLMLDFEMSDAQQEHALAAQHLVPRLVMLKKTFCPESLFWKMYFVNLYPKLEKEDAMLLSTSQLVKAWARATSMEGDNSARGVVGVTDRAVSFARDIARYPETWLDYLLLDDDDDFELSNAQQQHALAIKHLAPRLAALRLELCPGHMNENYFWKIYFVHLHPILEEEDAKLLSTAQILKVWANLSTELRKIRRTNSIYGEHPVQVPYPQPYPWVMVRLNLASDGRLVQTFYSMADGEEYVTDHYNISGVHFSERVNDTDGFVGFSETTGLMVCASCYGWLILMNRNNGECFLLNVASMEKVRLPKLPSRDMVPDDITYGRVSKNYFVMTAPPTVTNCVVGVVLSTRTSFLIWRPGRHKWQDLSYDPHMLSHVVVCNHEIYCVVDSKYFGICDVVDDTLRVRILGHKFSTGDEPRFSCSRYLVKVHEDILSIKILRKVGRVIYEYAVVDKFDKGSKNWIRVEYDTINGCAIFLNGAHSFYTSADSRMVEGNTISICEKGLLCTFRPMRCKLKLLPKLEPLPQMPYSSQFVMLEPEPVGRLGIQDDFARIGGKFWTGIGVTGDVVSFARDMAMNPQTWLSFPLPDDEDGIHAFEMSSAQQEHALAVEHLAPTLDELRMKLCSGYISESRFWKIYFVLLHPRLEKEDALILSTPQIMQIVEAQATSSTELQEHTVEVPERGSRSMQRDRWPSRRREERSPCRRC